MSLSKKIIAGVIAGGVLVSGVTWLGAEYIPTIKQNIDEMAQELQDAISDRDYLANQFNNLKGVYINSIDEANATIQALLTERDSLTQQIDELRQQLSEMVDNEELDEAREEIQTEIDRLESELNQANQDIEELLTYVETKNAEIDYQPIDRTQYEVEELEVINLQSTDSVPIDTEALSFNESASKYLAQQSVIDDFMSQYNKSKTVIETVKKVTVSRYQNFDMLAYEIITPMSVIPSATSEVEQILKQAGIEYFLLVDKTGKVLAFIRL